MGTDVDDGRNGLSRRGFLRGSGAGLLAAASGAAIARGQSTAASAFGEAFGERTRAGSPGFAVGVCRGGAVLLNEGYGYADLESPRPVTADTVFHVASVSKQFTALAIALLAERGAVDLDGDIRDYLPFVPDFGHAVTVRHLIHHTSGLRDQWTLFVLGGRTMSDRLEQQQVLNLVARQRALNFVPGTAYAYSNTGYTLLAEVARAASGRPLRAFARDEIFEPLDMTQSFLLDDLGEVVPDRAFSYRRGGDDGDWQRVPLNYETVGATSLMTTTRDLLRWTGELARPAVFDPALMARLYEPSTLRDGTPLRYGFGLMQVRLRGERLVLHTGSDAGFRSALLWFPDADLSIVVLMNDAGDLYDVVETVASRYLDGLADPRAKAVAAPAALLDELEGHYLGPTGRRSTLTRCGDRLVFGNGANDGRTVTFRDDGTFDLGRTWAGHFRPVRTGTAITGLEHVEPFSAVDRPEVYRRTSEHRPAEAELEALAGDYRSGECDATYSLRVEDGRLMLSSLWIEPVALTPTAPDHFDSSSWAVGSVVVERDAHSRPTALLFNSSRVAGLRLARVTDDRPTAGGE